MQNENISIDQLEDQLIDNPDPTTTKQLSESSLDEAFQKKPNGRANQLYGKYNQGESGTTTDAGCYPFLVVKPILDYAYSDSFPLRREIAEWFSSPDYDLINLHGLPQSYSLPLKFDSNNIDLWSRSTQLDNVLYFALGTFGNTNRIEDQIENIISNCRELVTTHMHKSIIDLTKRYLKEFCACLSSDSTKTVSKIFCSNYFKTLTILYCIVITSLHSEVPDELRLDLAEKDLMSDICLTIELWQADLNPHIRMRSILLLFWKLILLEFGDTAQLKNVDLYLSERHSIKNKERKSADNVQLTCSPLEFFTFKEDLIDKYPICDTKPYSHSPLENEKEDVHPSTKASSEDLAGRQKEFMAFDSFTNSLSNLLEIPRPNKSHSVLGQLPTQTIHIATPVPSPPSTPSEFMFGGEKIRKMYHVNQGMPFVYPTDGKSMPVAINEATDLIEDAYYESYSNKRLWEERQRYMCQERGNVNQYELSVDSDNFATEQSSSAEARSLARVESFYGQNLSRLHSLVKLLVDVIKNNNFDFNLKEAETELNPETSFSLKFASSGYKRNDKIQRVILGKLETLRVKETTLKASSAILILLLRWFKVSHVLKSYYFSSLLFDAQYLSVFMDFLANSFNNPSLQDSLEGDKETYSYDTLITQNKLMNPDIRIPQFEFFSVCQNIDIHPDPIILINRTKVCDLPSVVDENNQSLVHIKEFNADFCFILSNLLNVTNRVLIKNISQRVFVFNETKPTDLLKIILLNFVNDSLKIPILKIFKKLAPYQGRKWRALNMDVVSQVYLNLKLSLRDTWLSGRDLENDFNNSFDQEIALRSLLQFYNTRVYPGQMKPLGYTVNQASFPSAGHDSG
ncbi:hypothetical protein CLUG_03638 [Clavispora lusitaniae ATCC 42720]|uniref:Factor arrest protein n=1 Tax=Clavispora lusitaniae (strain ATCC 42720) TaxID=306902 RepID=C4Y654_CLAL4|nr:uncharacterized protein CLUG_03638 [Clavispora lusitaniae ATCC 42720]EEQ39510.1 hypothetical protein CLUG_03638 [Clavispora lusitaniae ATCC 42720]